MPRVPATCCARLPRTPLPPVSCVWPYSAQSRPLNLNAPQPPPQPFYGPFSGTTRVSRRQKRTSGLYGASED